MIYATLYRFGYSLEVIANTEKEARAALIKEYNKAFFNINKCKPNKEEIRRRNEDIEIREFNLNTVEWY